MDESRIVDELAARFPGLPRSRVELAFEVYGPDRNVVEAKLQQLATDQAMRILRDGQLPLS